MAVKLGFDPENQIKELGYRRAMLSQKTRYALHALLVLAKKRGEAPVLTANIAAEARVPRKFLEQILLELKKRGVVRSIRGRAGGYLLGRDAHTISFAEIIRITEGPLALAPCASVTAYQRCVDCSDEKTCAIRKALLAARDATASVLEGYTLGHAVQRGKSRRKHGA